MVVTLQTLRSSFHVDHLAEPGHPAGPSPIILIGNADGAFQPQVLYAVEFARHRCHSRRLQAGSGLVKHPLPCPPEAKELVVGDVAVAPRRA
jgi:hypothetical protein